MEIICISCLAIQQSVAFIALTMEAAPKKGLLGFSLLLFILEKISSFQQFLSRSLLHTETEKQKWKFQDFCINYMLRVGSLLIPQQFCIFFFSNWTQPLCLKLAPNDLELIAVFSPSQQLQETIIFIKKISFKKVASV